MEILEYCDSKDLIKREQYYIDLLNPEYNILKIAGSRLGSTDRTESRVKISSYRAGKKHTEETLAKMKGRILPEEIRKKITAALKGKKKCI